MTSPCTAPRILRCRLKDLASCFYACRFPLDEEPKSFRSPLPQLPNGSMVINLNGRHRSHRAKRRITTVETRNQGVSVQNSTGHNSTNSQKNDEGSSDSSWPRFAEEDYIVFLFREDGEIHMISDGNSEQTDEVQRAKSTSSRPINRKLNYGEDIEESSDSRSGKDMVNDGEKDIHRTIDEDIAKGDEKRSNDKDTESHSDEIKEINRVEESSKTDSAESCDSIQSDSSTSSFAFPMLGWEWIGSPVQMPKSEDKSRSRNLLRHCCRF